jgi:hypothetical protein
MFQPDPFIALLSPFCARFDQRRRCSVAIGSKAGAVRDPERGGGEPQPTFVVKQKIAGEGQAGTPLLRCGNRRHVFREEDYNQPAGI